MKPKKFIATLFGLLILTLAASFFLQNIRYAKESAPELSPPKKLQVAPAQALPPAESPVKKSIQPKDSTNKDLYEEIIYVLQKNYANPSALTFNKLNQSAIQGVLASLNGSVRFVNSEEDQDKASSRKEAIVSVSLINPLIGYIRVDRIDENTAEKLEKEVQKFVGQHVTGFILDLRFAEGSRYSVVPAVASIFLHEARPLFSIQREAGEQTYLSKPPLRPTDAPLVILINRATREAPETLAAVLQDQGRALLVGSSATAGQAFETSDIKLSNNQILRVATGKIVLAKGGEFFLKVMKPDVAVVFDDKLEKEIYEQPFVAPEQRSQTRYYSEAILTGREIPIMPVKDKTKKEPNEPASNHDEVLMLSIDLLKSINAIKLSSLN